MRRTLVPLVPLVVAALGLAAVGPAGSAAGPSGPPTRPRPRPTHHRIVDPARDVYLLLENPDGCDAGFARRPRVRNGDITSAVVRHRAAAVTVSVRLAKLRRPGPLLFTVASLRTARTRGTRRSTPTRSDGTPEVFFDNNRGGEVSCPRARARIDYAADVIRVRVPRRCMDYPAWVRPSVATVIARRAAESLLSTWRRASGPARSSSSAPGSGTPAADDRLGPGPLSRSRSAARSCAATRATGPARPPRAARRRR